MGRSILEEIAERTAERVAEGKKRRSPASVRREAEELGRQTGFPFRRALASPGISFICEVKRASPSKGMIAEEFPYLSIAREYEAAGAAAISVLTEPYYFLGRDEYLQEIAGAVSVPVLRKDFIVDEYQIFQAKVIGASAVLLICALLEQGQLDEYLAVAHSLGLSVLAEVHTEEEAETAVRSGAGIIGVNNRNLKTFETDINTSVHLRRSISEDILFVSESGIQTPEDMKKLTEIKTDAVLIGEAFMRIPDKRGMLETLSGRKKEG